MLYGLAPLPYATGLLPLLLGEETDIRFLPEVKEAVNMTFSQRNKLGFKLALQKDVELFFGLGKSILFQRVSFSLGFSLTAKSPEKPGRSSVSVSPSAVTVLFSNIFPVLVS